MLKNIVIDNTLNINAMAHITGVDQVGEYATKVHSNSVDWLPGGHFYGIEYGFWTIIVYLTIVGNSFADVEKKRDQIMSVITKRKKHDIEIETLGGKTLGGVGVIYPLQGSINVESQLLQEVALKITFLWPLKANERSATFTPSVTRGLVIPFAVPLSFATVDDSSVVTVENNGNMWFYPEISVRGPVGQIIITNQANGMSLRLLSGLTSGQVFRAYFDENYVYKINDTDATYMVEGTLPRLEIGQNRFAISAKSVGTGASATIKYWDYFYGI